MCIGGCGSTTSLRKTKVEMLIIVIEYIVQTMWELYNKSSLFFDIRLITPNYKRLDISLIFQDIYTACQGRKF